MILLPDLHSEHEAYGVANKFIKALRSQFQCEDNQLNIDVSIGISFYPNDGSTAEELIRVADIAMYAAKGNGGGAYRQYEKGMKSKT
jgi:diguanylate cyclase (GGDEF)-like protein